MGEIKIESIIKPKDSTPESSESEIKNDEWLLRKTIEKIPEKKDKSSTLLEQLIQAGILL